MAVSYNGLWKLLIDKNMKKMELVENENIGISSSTLAKMSKGEDCEQTCHKLFLHAIILLVLCKYSENNSDQ